MSNNELHWRAVLANRAARRNAARFSEACEFAKSLLFLLFASGVFIWAMWTVANLAAKGGPNG